MRRDVVEGYPVTPQMVRADDRCRDQYGVSLREYLLAWRPRHPFSPGWDELAVEFGISQATIYRWFDRLQLRSGGPVLVDLNNSHS